MHQRLAEVTGAVEQAAAGLRSGYRAEELYALRVGMRRIRSMLKAIGSPRSRRFRKTWRGFTAVTNRARDWDVFLLAARDVLQPRPFARFEQRNRERVAHCHEAVRRMLESPHWHRHVDEWRSYLRRTHDRGPARPAPRSLARALGGARSALATATARGDPRSWHKFRIAVKELRYQAESGTASPTDAARLEIIEECKLVQALLGSWHDCVVQVHMLDGLEPAPEHDGLRDVILRRGEQRLAEIEAAVAGHSLFAGGGSSITSSRS